MQHLNMLEFSFKQADFLNMLGSYLYIWKCCITVRRQIRIRQTRHNHKNGDGDGDGDEAFTIRNFLKRAIADEGLNHVGDGDGRDLFRHYQNQCGDGVGNGDGDGDGDGERFIFRGEEVLAINMHDGAGDI